MTMACNILLIACGFFLPKIVGTILSAGALFFLGLTAAFPFYFPPSKRIYQAFLIVSLGFGGIIGLFEGFIG